MDVCLGSRRRGCVGERGSGGVESRLDDARIAMTPEFRSELESPGRGPAGRRSTHRLGQGLEDDSLTAKSRQRRRTRVCTRCEGIGAPMSAIIRHDDLVGISGNYRVRQASEADLANVLGILAENQGPPVETTAVPRSPMAREATTWQRMMNTSDLAVLVAEHHDDEAVGTATILTMPNLTYGCRPTAFIEALVVKYAHRRRGVGRLLLRHLVARARDVGCHKVQLLSHKRHATDGAHTLYLSAGFVPEAEGFRLYLNP
jgi:GNAT superfamily N-acetyltransferase